MYTDVMVDLETLGNKPGAPIISIGAVAFALDMPEQDWGLFNVPFISRASNTAVGLHADQSTLDWWSRQTADARRTFDEAVANGMVCQQLPEALNMFDAFVTNFVPSGEACVWGNGADFDLPILVIAYSACKMRTPWKFWNSRCYRTMKNMFAVEPPAFVGTKHSALADAQHQTRHLLKIISSIKGAVK